MLFPNEVPGKNSILTPCSVLKRQNKTTQRWFFLGARPIHRKHQKFSDHAEWACAVLFKTLHGVETELRAYLRCFLFEIWLRWLSD
jgi:hypothetical protein